MIDLTRKTAKQLRGLINFYQRRSDHGAVRMIENEILRRRNKPKRRRRKKEIGTTVPLGAKPDPRDCVHDWIPMNDTRIVNRFRCRICETIGWQDGLYDGRVRVYICQHQGCRRPVTKINSVGMRTCKEHYQFSPLKPRAAGR